ncbi:MAG TPA: CheR family methyltransferase [Terracidiphilus sp.]|nr:CheR family methyltransferase [Terracidiphilus sp.]
MPYTHILPKSTSFSGTGLEGYAFGPLRQKDLDIYYIECRTGHDTFIISRKITRTYYVLAGSGYFTIANQKHEIYPGMLIEVPPGVEYTYSGQMTLIAFSRPRWFRNNDAHTRWNPDVTAREEGSLPGHEPLLTRLVRKRIAGKSPLDGFLGLNRRLWNHIPADAAGRGLIRLYGSFVHSLARRAPREQAFATHFLRNRPGLKLIQSLVDSKKSGEKVQIAVLGCSFGAEAYSIAWSILSARPDLELVLSAVDISAHAVDFARRGVYGLTNSEPTTPAIFDRMSPAEKESFFDIDGESWTVKQWIKDAIRWNVCDVGEPETLEKLGEQDLVVANNFLCHMMPQTADRCLRNIARLVGPNGYLYVSGIDLDVRTKVMQDLGWKPVRDLLEEIHNGDPVMPDHWPFAYAGLEPIDKRRADWVTRYAAVFQSMPGRSGEMMEPDCEHGVMVGGK